MSAESLALAAMRLEDVAVSEEDGRFVFTREAREGEADVTAEAVVQAIREHGFAVDSVTALFDDRPAVRIEAVPREEVNADGE